MAAPSPAPTTTIRPARHADAPRIAAIHDQGIAEREATFDTDRVDPAAVVQRIARCDREPLLVAERGGEVLGWAGAIRSSDRCAAAGVGEYTIYLDRSARGAGLGRALLVALGEAAEQAGFWKLIGRLFTTNAASIALARSAGFREVGVHERQGRLDGRWKDVLLVERLLGDAVLQDVAPHDAGRASPA